MPAPTMITLYGPVTAGVAVAGRGVAAAHAGRKARPAASARKRSRENGADDLDMTVPP